MKTIPTTLIAAFILFFISANAQVSWKVDRNHSQMEFSIKYMMVNDFEGRFKMYDGKINSNSETDFSNAVFLLWSIHVLLKPVMKCGIKI